MTDNQINQLVTQAQQGEQHAFSNIVKLYQQKVFRYCYAMLANQQDAEDLTQDTFIRAYKSLSHYSHEDNFVGWLLTIAHRLCLNKLKKNNRLYALLQKLYLEQSPTYTDEPESHHNDYIFTLLNSLKPKHRAVVIFKVIHGFSYEEMSRILQDNPTKLRKQYERAKKALQKKSTTIEKIIEGGEAYEYRPNLRTTNS